MVRPSLISSLFLIDRTRSMILIPGSNSAESDKEFIGNLGTKYSLDLDEGSEIYPAGPGRGFSKVEYNGNGAIIFNDPENDNNVIHMKSCSWFGDSYEKVKQVSFYHKYFSAETDENSLKYIDWAVAHAQDLVSLDDYTTVMNFDNPQYDNPITRFYQAHLFTWEYYLDDTQINCQMVFAENLDSSKTIALMLRSAPTDGRLINSGFKVTLDGIKSCANILDVPDMTVPDKTVADSRYYMLFDTSYSLPCLFQSSNPCIDIENGSEQWASHELYNPLPTGYNDIISYEFTTSDQASFGEVIALHSCREGSQLYPIVKEIGLDASFGTSQTSYCSQNAEEYNMMWTKLGYECLTPIEFKTCDSFEGLSDIYNCQHGTCMTDEYSVRCDCHPGFEQGEDLACSNQINECASETHACLNGATCIDINPAAGLNFPYACLCDPEYESSLESNEVAFGGTCGEKINDCEIYGSSCTKHGDESAICVDGIRSTTDIPAYSCSCTETTTLAKTFYYDESIHSCIPNNPCQVVESPCNEQGTCQYFGGDTYKCICKPGFEGDFCENEINICDDEDICINGECNLFIGSNLGYTCDCHDGWKGKDCNENLIRYERDNFILKLPILCKNAEDTTEEDNYWKNNWEADLKTLFVETYGATDLFFKRVFCRPEYHGAQFVVISKIDDTIPVVRSIIARNNSTELAIGMDFASFKSNIRKRRSTGAQLAPRVADIAGKLDLFVVSNSDLEAVAEKDEIVEFFDDDDPDLAEKEEFVEVDVCAPSDDMYGAPTLGGCKNGALCVPTLVEGVTLPTCDCGATGYEGVFCGTAINNCDGVTCFNDGECTSYIGVGTYYCECPFGFKGTHCETNLYPDGLFCYNDGNGQPCENNQLCVNNACQCGAGIDEESVINFQSEGITCGKRNFCEYTILTSSTPRCENGGHCFNEERGFTCICLDGYIGDQCQFNIEEMCEDLDCSGNGECAVDTTDMSNIFVYCNCQMGYMGTDCFHRNSCRLDRPCSEFTIENGCTPVATLDGTGDFSCDCIDGYEGKTCNIGACDAGSSKNTCNSGFDDLNSCETKIDDDSGKAIGFCNRCLTQPKDQIVNVACSLWTPVCRPNSCDKKGSYECQADKQGNRVCMCNPRYSGDFCKVFTERTENCPSLGPTEKISDMDFISIQATSNQLEENINNKGQCHSMIKYRILGSIEIDPFDTELMEGAKHLLTYFYPFMDSDSATFSQEISNIFFESFKSCSDTGCISEKFCDNFSLKYQFTNLFGKNFAGQIKQRCMAEAWRFASMAEGQGVAESCNYAIENFASDGADCKESVSLSS